MGKQIKGLCKVIRGFTRRGELTRQQGKTLIGPIKHSDIEALEKA